MIAKDRSETVDLASRISSWQAGSVNTERTLEACKNLKTLDYPETVRALLAQDDPDWRADQTAVLSGLLNLQDPDLYGRWKPDLVLDADRPFSDISHDGKLALLIDEDGKARLMDLSKEKETWLMTLDEPISEGCILPDGIMLQTIYSSGEASLYFAQPDSQTIVPAGQLPFAASFIRSRENQILLADDKQALLTKWNGEPIQSEAVDFPVSLNLNDWKISPDGKKAAGFGEDGLWILTEKELHILSDERCLNAEWADEERLLSLQLKPQTQTEAELIVYENEEPADRKALYENWNGTDPALLFFEEGQEDRIKTALGTESITVSVPGLDVTEQDQLEDQIFISFDPTGALYSTSGNKSLNFKRPEGKYSDILMNEPWSEAEFSKAHWIDATHCALYYPEMKKIIIYTGQADFKNSEEISQVRWFEDGITAWIAVIHRQCGTDSALDTLTLVSSAAADPVFECELNLFQNLDDFDYFEKKPNDFCSDAAFFQNEEETSLVYFHEGQIIRRDLSDLKKSVIQTLPPDYRYKGNIQFSEDGHEFLIDGLSGAGLFVFNPDSGGYELIRSFGDRVDVISSTPSYPMKSLFSSTGEWMTFNTQGSRGFFQIYEDRNVYLSDFEELQASQNELTQLSWSDCSARLAAVDFSHNQLRVITLDNEDLVDHVDLQVTADDISDLRGWFSASWTDLDEALLVLESIPNQQKFAFYKVNLKSGLKTSLEKDGIVFAGGKVKEDSGEFLINFGLEACNGSNLLYLDPGTLFNGSSFDGTMRSFSSAFLGGLKEDRTAVFQTLHPKLVSISPKGGWLLYSNGIRFCLEPVLDEKELMKRAENWLVLNEKVNGTSHHSFRPLIQNETDGDRS